jgi:hypothetical protein
MIRNILASIVIFGTIQTASAQYVAAGYGGVLVGGPSGVVAAGPGGVFVGGTGGYYPVAAGWYGGSGYYYNGYMNPYSGGLSAWPDRPAGPIVVEKRIIIENRSSKNCTCNKCKCQ